MCIMKYVKPDCGQDYAEALADASFLVDEDIPKHCVTQANGGTTLTAAKVYLYSVYVIGFILFKETLFF